MDEFVQNILYCTVMYCILLIENRIYREEFTRKKCKTAILLYSFHTAGVLHIFMLYNLLGPGTWFYRKSKINVKKTNLWNRLNHNWPMIISHRLYAFHFQTMIFRYNINQMMFFSANSFYKVYLTALKNSKLKWIVKRKFLPRD